jgi:hypothetical protein
MMVDGEDDLLKELELERYDENDIGDDVLIPEMINEVPIVERHPVDYDRFLKDCSKMRRSVYYYYRKMQEPLQVTNDVIPSDVRSGQDMLLTGMIKVKKEDTCSDEDVFASDILRTVGRADIYKLERQMGGNPPPVKDRKNNWDIDLFETPSKKEVERFIPKCVDLGVHKAFNAYGDAIMRNGEKFRAALKGGILYLLPYAPFVNASTPRDAMIGSLPIGLYEVIFYYIKPFVDKQVCTGVAATGGEQNRLYPQIWNELFAEYEFIHWAVLETVCGRCFSYEWFEIRFEDEYLFKIGENLWVLLVLINNEVCADSAKLEDLHWERIVKNFGVSWRSIFKFL